MKKVSIVIMMIITAIGVLFLSFFLGRYSISPSKALLLLGEKLFNISSGLDENSKTVFFNIRGPRVIAAFIIGMGLSLSGCVYQGVFRNPIVSPDILGATAGAGLGAAVGLLLDFNNVGVQITAFIFGLVSVFITYSMANVVGKQKSMILVLVLSGMVVSALFQAGISLIKYVADPYSKLPAITFWLMGSLSSVLNRDIPMLLVPLLIGAIPLFLLRWRMNVLSFSDEEAESMGINTNKLRLIIIICATLITSSAISIGGIIGWVGLIIPHLARTIVGPDNKVLLPVSMIMGGSYLLLIDDLARSISSMEIPLGVLTAVIGAPFFMILMYKSKHDWS